MTDNRLIRGLGGLLHGVGEGMAQQGKEKRALALEALRQNRADQRAQADRDFRADEAQKSRNAKASMVEDTFTDKDGKSYMLTAGGETKPLGVDITPKIKDRERRAQMLIDTGVDPDIAKGIAAGRYQISRDPVTGVAQVVDMATGDPIQKPQDRSDQAPALNQEPSGGERSSLWGMVGDSTGVLPAIQEFGQGIAGQVGVDMASDELLQRRQQFRNAQNDLIRALSINPRFPVAEMERIRREVNIEPGVLTDEKSLRARMRSLDGFLQQKLEREHEAARDKDLPADTRQDAATAAKDIMNFLQSLGVPRDEGSSPIVSEGKDGIEPPPVGTIEDGYRFLGGDPANPSSWERAQ